MSVGSAASVIPFPDHGFPWGGRGSSTDRVTEEITTDIRTLDTEATRTMASRTMTNHATASPTARRSVGDHATTGRRNLWALWGVPAAILGFASSFITASYDGLDTTTGPQIIEQLDRSNYHLG